ncbi:MAG: ribokinase [Acidobacteriota bacterium]
MGRVVVVGSSNTDLIVKVDRLPRPGHTVLGREFLEAAGGKGANQAVAAARLGADVVFVAKIGADPYGDRALAGFRSDGICVDWVLRDAEAPSGIALIMVEQGGENLIAVAPGANARLGPEDLRKCSGAFSGAEVVLCQLEIPVETVVEAARQARSAGARFVLNPAPPQPIPEELWNSIDVLTPNEHEAAVLAGMAVADRDSALAAARYFRELGAGAVVVTLGEAGCLVLDEAGWEEIPAPHVTAVDTTAAGDAFSGALAAALAEGSSLREAARDATRVAALSVTRWGAQRSLPRRDEVEGWR